MLKVEIKFSRSTTWNLQVRYHARSLAMCITDLHTFAGSFNEELKKYPRTNAGHISNAYKAEVVEDRCEIVWTGPTINKRLIAVITKEK